jgi:hypothetical protein
MHERKGFQAFGVAVGCRESEGEHFDIQSMFKQTQKFGPQLLESYIIHLPCDFCPFHHLSHREEVRNQITNDHPLS